MALLYSEGFDKILDKTQWGSFGIGAGSTSSTIAATGGRFGGRCATLVGSSGGTDYFYVPIGTHDLTAKKLHAAGWFYVKNTPASRYNPLLAFVNRTSNYGIGLGVYGNNIEAFGWTNVPAGSPNWVSGSILATAALSADTWHHIEICCDVKDSGGTFKVWLDGTLVINVSGDTLYAANATATGVNYLYFGFGYSASGFTSYLDDVIVWDETGGSFNTAGPLGEHRIWTLSPEGDHACDFTPSTGSNRYAVVDDATLDAADYNSSIIPGSIDTFTFSDLSVSPNTIHAINAKTIANKTGTGLTQLRGIVRVNDTNYYSAANATLALTAGITSLKFEKNPATNSAWTASAINALLAGYEYVS